MPSGVGTKERAAIVLEVARSNDATGGTFDWRAAVDDAEKTVVDGSVSDVGSTPSEVFSDNVVAATTAIAKTAALSLFRLLEVEVVSSFATDLSAAPRASVTAASEWLST
ncbi:hypothetical protein [Mycolicibacterium grossiae]|uniref:hypothetical protein n=1 Tax=Mycolicibacterium grossiae TaxID=1552759 RepID=UPI000F7A99A9|nr:hypothetical protein [Mycolicibacterium grossiae]